LNSVGEDSLILIVFLLFAVAAMLKFHVASWLFTCHGIVQLSG